MRHFLANAIVKSVELKNIVKYEGKELGDKIYKN